MTASAVLGEHEKCRAAGMDDFLVKPADFAALEHTLARWTGLASRRRATGGSQSVERGA